MNTKEKDQHRDSTSLNNNSKIAINPILEQSKRFINSGLSVIPTKEDKTPAILWAEYQKRKMINGEIEKNFSHAKAIAIICGEVSGNLEVIDIDCKYDNTGNLAKDFFDLIKDNIPDVFEKLVITATKSKGWHVYYRCSSIAGNKKLANNKSNQVLIETRGEGGYVIAPPSTGYFLKKGSFDNIPEISNDEREIILSIAACFDETQHETKHEATYSVISPFDDYNQRGDVVQLLVKHGWTITKQSGDRIHFKRPGDTDSKVSGNWHEIKRIFYPFTTSTVFESQRGYNATAVYCILECNSDYSEASHRLYADGFGERNTNTTEKKQSVKKEPKQPLAPLPITGFPKEIQQLIKTCTDVYQTPRDFWAGAVIMATALAIGDKLELKTKYSNVPVLWMSIIGDVSSGKTEAQNLMLNLFKELDSKAFEEYQHKLNDYERLSKMTKNDRKAEGITDFEKPIQFQYLLNDLTPESIAEAHRINKRGMMIERDELKGWLDDFGRYNKSGEQSNMLSTFNRISIAYNRKAGNNRIDKPTLFVFGGMQPDLLPTLANDSRAENGFLARMCFVYPDQTLKPGYSEKTLPDEMDAIWRKYINDLLNLPEITVLSLSGEAKEIYKKWMDKNKIETDNESSGYLKGVYGKLDIISLRISIVIKGMKLIFEGDYDTNISGEIMQSAVEITEYFRATALKVYNKIFANQNTVSNKEVIKHLHSLGKSQNEIAAVLNLSQPYVSKILNNG